MPLPPDRRGRRAGPAELRRRLAPFGERVSFRGWVAPCDVPRLAREHDAMVMPSRYEGFGMTLIEAMSEGCPAVASRIAGVTDTIVRDGEDGFLFAIGNCRQAAAHIDRLAADPALRARMADAAAQKSRRPSTMMRSGAPMPRFWKIWSGTARR